MGGLKTPVHTPHGRVVAKIVCVIYIYICMTLECNTQHTVFFLSSFRGKGKMVSFDSDYSDGDGASPSFSSGQFVFILLPLCFGFGGGFLKRAFVESC